jgi:DNA-binding transcriptional regulator YiaG
MRKKEKRVAGSESPIEALRIERTNLSQIEFVVHCGIPLRTYQRWINGDTEAKLSPRQWKALMQILNLPPEEVPDDFGVAVLEEAE